MNSMDAGTNREAGMASSPAAPISGSARSIALMNQKGGVGKTTTTVNIGASLAARGRRALLIDLDPQAHMTLHLGVETAERATTYDLLVDPRVKVADVLVTARPNLDVIPAETDLAAAELELSARPGREFILGNKLKPHLDRYDVILFDCPPSLGILTLNALATAKEVFVPMQAHFLPLQGVGKLLETVGLVCENVNPALRVTAIILCAHEGNTTLSKEIVADLEGFFEKSRGQPVAWRDCRILEPAIRRNIKLAEAPSFGQTIFEYAPWCIGALDYAALVDQLVSRWWPGDRIPAPKSQAAATATPPTADSSVEVKTHAVIEPPVATIETSATVAGAAAARAAVTAPSDPGRE
jgi:chromosome partitioning protein